ncbi:MAG: hypothetical protein AAF961_06115 [Planctomycetota bacterium]
MNHELHVARSNSITASEVARLLSRWDERFGDAGFELSPDDTAMFTFGTSDLPQIDAFARNTMVSIYAVTAPGTAQPALRQLLVSAVAQGTRNAGILRRVRSSAMANADDSQAYDLSISTGIGRQGYYCALDNSFPKSHAPGHRDRSGRAKLFRSAVAAIGLEDFIEVRFDGENLTMHASEPWGLHHRVVELRGRNPASFSVLGFSGLDDAAQAADKLVELVEVELCHMGFGASFLPDSYETARHRMNELWRGWVVEVSGMLSEASLNLIRGVAGDGPIPVRVPVFGWYEEELVRTLGTIVKIDGELHLEIAGVDMPAEPFDERVACFEGASFKRVFP